MNQNLIELEHITKSYDGDVILDDLNLSVKPNSFVTLLGPSGCGKTTTLRIIGGFETPDKGRVIFDGQDIDEVSIAAPDGRPWVTLRCPGFPFLAVWANPKGPFICLEPWFGRTDEAGFAGTLEEKKGMERLEGGEKRAFAYEIEFHR